MPTIVGVTCNSAYPVRIDAVRRIIGDLAEVQPVEVPGWTLRPDEEARFAEALQEMVCVLARPGTFSRSLLARLPDLQHIAVHGAGYDKIDVDAATELGIQITNAPGANATSVAELTLGLCVVLARRVVSMTNALHVGQWGEARGELGLELAGRRLGILGVGQVGSRVAALGRAFGMDVVAYDPAYTPAEFQARGITWLPTEEVVRTADFLTLHVPLDTTTRRMIDARLLGSMRRGAYFLNLSRGPVVDEAALAEALVSGQLAGAALDVREHEPPGAGDILRGLPNVILTPHIGGSTDGALERIAEVCAHDMAAVLLGRPVAYPVNAPEPSVLRTRMIAAVG